MVDGTVHRYVVLVSQDTERRFEEVDAPDIETAATVSDGIVVAMRRPPVSSRRPPR